MSSVTNAQKRTNDVASAISDLHGDAGLLALFFMRVRRQNRDANVQAFRDIVADEVKEHRRIARSEPLDMQFIGGPTC